MKLIKKIAAIMFAFMMVVSMSCNVKADDTTTPTTGEGKITINNAIPGQTYKIYKILELESYNPTTKNYAYKITPEWKKFIETEGNGYLTTVDGTDYVNWVGDLTNSGQHVKEFAEKAIAYVKQPSNTVTPLQTKDATTASAEQTTTTVTFENLPLGYYLVDSSVGSLCGLDTTAKEINILEKNSVPTVTKKIIEENEKLVETNTVNYGDIVNFQIKINIGKGAEKYVLHDKMDPGLTLNTSTLSTISPISFHDESNSKNDPRYNTDFTVNTTPNDGCTFHVEFNESYLKTLTDSVVLTGRYTATVNENAKTNQAINNKTWLAYGDNKKSTESKTETYTYGIKVFKYKKNGETQEGLKDAQFKLYTDDSCANEVNLKTDTDGLTYFVTQTKTGDNLMTSPKLGRFEIKGLKAGTYYLKEIEAPQGYNKLASPITIKISQDSSKKQVINVGDSTESVTEVGVENKTGKVLPSTGGAGTTMIYLVGAVLVLGSGVVLATKRRVKNK